MLLPALAMWHTCFHLHSKYEVLLLKVIHRRHCTGFEQARELPLHVDDLIAGRYQVGYVVGPALDLFKLPPFVYASAWETHAASINLCTHDAAVH
jgi:hypothetical protein